MNRRRSTRTPCAGRLAWALAHDSRIEQPGWLSDRSIGGMAFITAASAAARPGDTIQVLQSPQERFANRPEAHAYEVRRVAPYDEHLCLVACRRV